MRTPRRWPRRKRTRKDGRTMSRQDRTNTDAIAAGWVAREDRGPLPAQERAQLQAWLDEDRRHRSEEHTSELQSLMRISYAVFCLKKKIDNSQHTRNINQGIRRCKQR